MRKNLLLVVLVFSLVLFFSKLGPAQNTYDGVLVDGFVHPCVGGGDVIVDINITLIDSVQAFVVPVFVTGSAGCVLDTILTGGLADANPPGFNAPSLVATFTQRIVNPYGPPGQPLLFVAVSFTAPLYPGASGRYCRTYWNATGPGAMDWATAVHPTGGPVSMTGPGGDSKPINWPAAGVVENFNIVREPEVCPVITQPTDTLKYFIGDVVIYNFSAVDAGGSDIVGAFIKPVVGAVNQPVLSGSNPWTVTWNTGVEAEGVYAIDVAVYDECCTTQCITNVKLTGVVGHIWIGNTLTDHHGGPVDPGDFVMVPIYLIAKADFGAFDLYVEFDPTLLYFKGVKRGPGLPEGWEFFTYRQLPCPSCGCCKYKLQLFGLYDIKDKHQGVFIPTAKDDTLIIAYLEFTVASDEWLRGFDLNICFEFDDETCTENTFSDVSGYFLYVSDNPEFFSYGHPCDTQFHGVNTVLNLMNFVLFAPPGTVNPDGRPCGGVLVRTTAEKERGDINLNLLAYDPADLLLFSSYFIYGTDVFIIDPPVQIANTDINADGHPLSLSDFILMIRIMLHDATPIPKPTPGSDLATIYSVTKGAETKVSTNANFGAVLFVFEGEGKVSSDLKFEQGVVDGQLRVLVYMNSSAGVTGELLTVEGVSKFSVEAVDNFGRPVKTTVVNKAIPTAFALQPNYPNPFNPVTNIAFALPVDSKVSLKIYNVAGQLVRTLVNETMPAGNHTVTWDGANSSGEKVASGIYFYKLNADKFSKTMKMVMTK